MFVHLGRWSRYLHLDCGVFSESQAFLFCSVRIPLGGMCSQLWARGLCWRKLDSEDQRTPQSRRPLPAAPGGSVDRNRGAGHLCPDRPFCPASHVCWSLAHSGTTTTSRGERDAFADFPDLACRGESMGLFNRGPALWFAATRPSKGRSLP